MILNITRIHDFSAGHRVCGHESKCANLHGHNYRVHLMCEADALDEIGRVVDFSVVKDTVCRWIEDNWDHKMLIYKDDTILAALRVADDGVISVPFNPTAENMAVFLVENVGPAVLPRGVRLIGVKIEETRKCSATYYNRGGVK